LQRRSLHINPLVALANLDKIGLERHFFSTLLDDFGPFGRAWHKSDEESTGRETLIRDLLAGKYDDPVRIVVFNTAEGWSRDATVEIADELRRRYVEYDEVPA
jgi:hypothetical protein